MVGRLYHMGSRRSRARAAGLLASFDAGRAAGSLSSLPLTSSHDDKGDQENDDSDDSDDVRHDRNETGDVACVSPDKADNRPSDEHGDHRS
jgi:hypothetical protein